MKTVKLLVAGSRGFKDYKSFEEKMNNYLNGLFLQFPNSRVEIVSGLAPGADQLAVRYVNDNKGIYTLKEFKANWEHYGKSAGLIRNRQMGFYCDQAIIFWDGKSRGTKHMISILENLNKKFEIVMLREV